MDIDKLKEGKRVKYDIAVRAGATPCTGSGKVIQVYRTKTGQRVVVHDKAQNKTVTARPSQLKAA